MKRGLGLLILGIAAYTVYREVPWGFLEYYPLSLAGIGTGIAASITWLAVRKHRAACGRG